MSVEINNMKKVNSILEPLSEIEAFDTARIAVEKRTLPIHLSGVIDSQKCHVIHGLQQQGTRVIITYNELRAKEIAEDMKFFCEEEVVIYPSKDVIFYSADVHSNDIERQRLEVVNKVIQQPNTVVVMAIDAAINPVINRDIFEKSILVFNTSHTVELEEIKKQLALMGYEQCEQAEIRGQYSVRGGILDIFPINHDVIYRIELWDDEIDSIRKVNPESQRSTGNVESIAIIPAREIVIDEQCIHKAVKGIKKDRDVLKNIFEKNQKLEEKERIVRIADDLLDKVENLGNFNGIDSLITYYFDELYSIIDYFDNPFIYIDEPAKISERYNNIKLEYDESMGNRLEKGYLLKGQATILLNLQHIIGKIENHNTVLLSTINHKQYLIEAKKSIDFTVKSINVYQHNFDILKKDLMYWCDNAYRVVLLSASKTRAERMVKLLNDANIPTYYMPHLEMSCVQGKVAVTVGNMHKGFEYPQIKFVVITESEIINQKKKKKRNKKFKDGRRIDSFTELKVGDYIVHENYGVGIFSGIEKIEIDGISKDYIKISYRDEGNLYITSNQLDVIQKYIGAEGKRPKLNKLGTSEWQKSKAKVKKAVEDLAEDLIKLYARRDIIQGHAYQKDTLWQKEFEEMFPYEETDDQLTAIEDTKQDMEGPKVMDRLVCGDVGYGKTEIAIRAAFKAVQDGKQVAYLVPTTILAQQHYNNFVQRMKDFPVNVEMLSRFRTPKDQKQIIKGLQSGLVDIVIGTHRLISKDIHFKDLGLLIVDEEQRFGVSHKEKIKQLKENIDVLTLTATPIPRTLHMSLIGIRDMSILDEPPQERHPIQTYVLEHNEELIKDAILREIHRGGQVYYVYNRVKDIDEVALKIAKLVPEAVVSFAHGQMSERQLENIMFDYINGDIDVLVSTTIIETGLDIQNANTMIIQDADRMGLSQLYQLRGRVGRSNRVAYAYLMYKRDKVLKEVAEKRLSAIREFTEFGSGFKIAMRDLEIRGAGNILGASQHGHMDAVGYELYCKLLEEAVEQLQDGKKVKRFDTTINMNVDAFIPERYIKDEVRKIEIYRKISVINTVEDYRDMQDELIDRYGDMPRSVDNLLEISLIKAMAKTIGIINIEQKGHTYTFYLDNEANLDAAKIPALVESYKNTLKFVFGEKPYFCIDLKHVNKRDIFLNIRTFLKKLQEMVP